MYNSCRILVLVLLLISCGHRQEKTAEQGISSASHLDEIEESAQPLTFVESTDPADSVWIGALDRIPLPPTVGQDSLINVYFKYKQPIEGYEVTARWMLSDARSRDGYIVMNFRDTNSGTSFHISSDEYANFNTDEVAHADNFGGHSDGDVYYFEYPSSEEWVWRDSLYLLGYTPPPFQFLDVDFDGQDELLVSEWENDLPDNYHTVYKIRDNILVEQNYVPLNRLSRNSQIDTVRQIIVLREHNGPDDIADLYFSKATAPIAMIEPLRLKTLSGQSVVEEYARLSCPVFSLDSIVSFRGLYATYEYRNICRTLQDKVDSASINREKLYRRFDEYNEPLWNHPGKYDHIELAEFPMPACSRKLIQAHADLFSSEAEVWRRLLLEGFHRSTEEGIPSDLMSVDDYWYVMKEIRSASIKDFYMALCSDGFTSSQSYAPVDLEQMVFLSSKDEYSVLREAGAWGSWYEIRAQISPKLPPKLRKVWDNCTNKAGYLRLKQFEVRYTRFE